MINLRRANGNWVIIVTFVIAFLLNTYPFPSSISWAMPKWTALIVIFWVVMLPHRIGITVSWFVGLFLDLLEGNLLGQNALALSVISYVLLILYQRMRMYALWQQSGVVFVLVGFYQLLCYWVLGISGVAFDNMYFFTPALMTALCWPVVWVVLNRVSLVFNVK